MTDRWANLRLARVKANEMRAARKPTLPFCTAMVEPMKKGGKPRVCRTRTTQNPPERARGIYWCPRCMAYPWGNGLRADIPPVEAWR